jgi:carboxyl-terminal processing protease
MVKHKLNYKQAFKNMKNLLLIVLLLAGLNIYFVNFSSGKDKAVKINENDSTTVLAPAPYLSDEDQLINTILSRYHYKKIHLNDSLSSYIFDQYLKTLDMNRVYFYQKDIDGFEKYRDSLDNDIEDGDLKPAYDIFDTFKKRVNQRIDYVDKVLDKGFDFKLNEQYQIDRDSLPWSKTDEEMNDVWRKKVKNDALNLIIAGKKWKDAKETLKKRYQNFRRAINQYSSEDVFQLFMNSYTESIDPHTNYLSPSTSENFKIDMSRSLEGIGAQLAQDDEYTKVEEVIPGGPADKSGLLKRNDKIIGVAQGDTGEMVDVIGWRITDVVQLIRGPKGTIVRLEILPANEGPNATPKDIKIVRAKVTLEEQSAKKSTIDINEDGKSYKMGVITIPAFYIDFDARQKGDPNYKSTTRDVKKLITELKTEKVDGIIIDLRDNGGGSLDEAINLTGLFIKDGPVVQVKHADGKIDVDEDTDPGVYYSGPLALLVNRFSASATEIFSAAIQDYGRGIIIGQQTYGKGTVQNLIDLNRLIPSDKGKLGQVKLTIAKFYRITGGSTQDKGVTPDIKLPSEIDEKEFGESTDKSALKWDRIASATYNKYGDIQKYFPKLRTEHDGRMQKTTEFDSVYEDIYEYNHTKSEKFVSLNEEVRKKEKNEQEQKEFERENARRKAKGLELLKKGEIPSKTENKIDPYLKESGKILADYIVLIS